MQIAAAFLVSEKTMSQRILRAKRKIGAAGIGFRTPPPHRLQERTGAVLAVLYLIFNAGYQSPDGVVAAEALRLARLVVELLPDDTEARGLLALLMFQQPPTGIRLSGTTTRSSVRTRLRSSHSTGRSPSGSATVRAPDSTSSTS